MAVISLNSRRHLGSFLFLLPFLCVTSPSDIPVPSFPALSLHSTRAQYLTKRDLGYFPSGRSHHNVSVLNPRLYSERLDILLVQSATNWLEIRWQLENKTGASVGVPRFSRVRCHIGNSTTFLRNITGSTNQFRIPNLSSNTEYIVCVETIEMFENVLHYKCVPFKTIPIIRADSILGLLLSLGYIFVMCMNGYVMWWMRVRKHASNHKHDNEMELSCRTTTIHCSEIEEGVQLNSHPSHGNDRASQWNSGRQ